MDMCRSPSVPPCRGKQCAARGCMGGHCLTQSDESKEEAEEEEQAE